MMLIASHDDPGSAYREREHAVEYTLCQPSEIYVNVGGVDSRTMINLHQLRLFVDVVRKGSFTQAAQLHFISQSALSAQVRRLEQSIGLPLFSQVHGKITLTAAGMQLFEVGQSLLRQEDAVVERVRALQVESKEVASVGVSPTGAVYPLLEAVREFRSCNAGFSVRLHIASAPSLFEELASGALDMVVEWDPIQQANVDWQPLGSSEYHVIASPFSGHRPGTVLATVEFVAAPFMALQGGFGSPGFVELTLNGRGLWPASATHLPSIDLIKRAVEAGLGLGFLSEISIRREVQAGHLVPLHLEGFLLRRQIALVSCRNGWKSPAAKRLMEFLPTSSAFAAVALPPAAPHVRSSMKVEPN